MLEEPIVNWIVGFAGLIIFFSQGYVRAMYPDIEFVKPLKDADKAKIRFLGFLWCIAGLLIGVEAGVLRGSVLLRAMVIDIVLLLILKGVTIITYIYLRNK